MAHPPFIISRTVAAPEKNKYYVRFHEDYDRKNDRCATKTGHYTNFLHHAVAIFHLYE